MSERLRIGVLGAGMVADRALVPAMHASRRAIPTAIASRDADRAETLARRHGIPTVHRRYEDLLDDVAVDAVYIALHNAAHLEWTVRALAAGKHVLCEKPLGLDAGEVQTMVDAADASGCSLMEALMYRFHPRMRQVHADAGPARTVLAHFGFPLTDTTNYRADPLLGGGALLDVGCYTLDVVRWFLGEPREVSAVAHVDGVDRTVAAALGFESGATALAWASFESPEVQDLVVVTETAVHRVSEPFTSWRDPHDPYQLMVDAFAGAVLERAPMPHPPEESLRTAELLDRVRAAFGTPSVHTARSR